MGFITNGKTDKLGEQATRAIAEGRFIFTARLDMPTFSFGQSGSIPDWAEMIESVERAGWGLAELAIAQDAKDRPSAFVVFRRRVA